MSLFFPKQFLFYDLLKDIGNTLSQIVVLFVKFSKNFKDSQKYARRAKKLEHQADAKTHEIIDKLNKTFITPFDREDIYLLAHDLDDIIDLIENVIHNIYLYRLTQKIDFVDEFAPLMTQASHHLEKLLNCLEQQKPSPQLVSTKIKMHHLEDKGDAIFAKTIAQLFTSQKDPITIIKLKDLLEALEAIMDKFQKVSDIIEGIIVKSG